MKAIDTNVLVRFLIDDDPDQCRRARALAARAQVDGERLFVSDVVLCEVVWVLSRTYRVKRDVVRSTLRSLLHADNLAFVDSAALGRALDAFERGRGDFADYVIREHARGSGATILVTFDAALLSEKGFVAPA